MDIEIVTPSPPDSRTGNRVTALRWAAILGRLGHRVSVVQVHGGHACALLIALHAEKSAGSVDRFRREHPDAPLIVGLAGTDLYGDLDSEPARRSLEQATHLVLLQPRGMERLPEPVRHKARVIYQSATAPVPRRSDASDGFPVCVVGNLREVKDPFRAAEAVRMLPESSGIRIRHVGEALTDEMRKRAEAETAENPRYQWLGELEHGATLELIASSRALVHSSRSEGGANVLSEALAASVPILSSRIPGSIGILGPDYPGFFPVGDSGSLADLLQRTETEPDFYQDLARACEALTTLVDPAREEESWSALLREVFRRDP
jgi:putative glycosyltransferase (TIGR04348 family)